MQGVVFSAIEAIRKGKDFFSDVADIVIAKGYQWWSR